ncbi:hypothetical protein [Ralstonia solanacearum]|uniref:hypothetical protein n=1 Tax=Ralstonia solanacearum TaxID=305 RepID=UPI0012D2A319|nr:hypothetical protein [Ralstonia solanacearum]
MSEIKEVIEITIIVAHILIIMAEWGKVVASYKRLTSKTASTTSKSLNFVRRNFIFIDILLILILGAGLFIAGTTGSLIFGLAFLTILLIISILFVPEDYSNHLAL